MSNYWKKEHATEKEWIIDKWQLYRERMNNWQIFEDESTCDILIFPIIIL